jgi:hypothetical protein
MLRSNEVTVTLATTAESEECIFGSVPTDTDILHRVQQSTEEYERRKTIFQLDGMSEIRVLT